MAKKNTVQQLIPDNRLVLFLLATAILMVLALVYMLTGKPTDTNPKITNFDQCAAAGNPVMESYPEQCSANGQAFINETENDDPGTSTFSFEELPQELQSVVVEARAQNCSGGSEFTDEIKAQTFATEYMEDRYAAVNIYCGDGGANGLFVKVDDQWKFVEATQFMWTCEAVNTYQISSSFTPECWDEPNDKVIQNTNQ